MIAKIKDLIQISEKIEEIKEKTDENTERTKEQTKTIQEFSEKLKEYNTNAETIQKNLSSLNEASEPILDNITTINKTMQNELLQIKMIKSNIHDKMVKELSEAFRDELRKQTKTLEIDVRRFNELKEQMEKLTAQMQGIAEEVSKMKTIAKEIKTSDFTLSSHAKELAKNDQEKLRLMRENDNLKRLISKERRSRS